MFIDKSERPMLANMSGVMSDEFTRIFFSEINAL